MSECSSNQPFHWITFFMVSGKFSQVEQVQLTPVTPPRRMSSNISRLQSQMFRPSKTMAFPCNSLASM